MPPQVTTETNFALEGFFSLGTVVVIGIVLLAVSWWMAHRDARFADRPRFVWFLFALRCLAILVLLWMLAGPTLVTSVKKLRMKSLALLVDASASMGLVDVIDGSGNVSRWAAARDRGDTKTIRALDEAVGTLIASRNQLEHFARIPNSTQNSSEARKLLAQAAQGIKTGVAAIKKAADDLPGSASELKRGLGEAAKTIESRVLDTLGDKSAEFNRGKTLASLERERWLSDRLAVLSVAVSQMENLADQFIKSVETPMVKSPGEVAAEESKLSRLDKVDAFVAAAEQTWLKDIRKKAVVNRYEFGEKVIPLGNISALPNSKKDADKRKNLSSATQIGAALQQVALDNTAQPVEAAILITDGGQNAGQDPREIAGSLSGTTLHVVPIGNTKMQRDVILHHTHAPRAVLQNDDVVIDSIVTAYDCDKEKLQVELLDNDRVVDQQTLNVMSEVFDSRVQLRWKAAHLGKHTLAFRVVPVTDERTEENNATKADIHVMEDKIRVLIADNFPRWETRYLLNLFKRDDRVVYDQLLFEPQRGSGEGVRNTFPVSLEEWSRYRVVILGDLLPTQLTAEHQKLLREYVTEAGGNLIIVAGKDAMPGAYLSQPLGSIIPVQAGDRALGGNNAFYLHLTDEGSMSLATQVAENPGVSERVWREMSERMPIYAMSEFSKPKPTTHSLIWASMSKSGFNPSDGSTRSFLAWHYVGAGRVVYLAAPVTYQLRYRQGDTFHHRFWGQLLRWAVARDLAEGSQTVRLSTDKLRYEQGESVQASVRLSQLDGRRVSGATPQISAIQEGKLIQEITMKEDASRPGTYNGALEALPVGAVKLEVSGDRVKQLLAAENYRRPVETTINIDPSGLLELRHPLANMPLLRQVADASGGMVLPPSALKSALQQLNLDPEVLENITKKPLWNRWDLFWLFILCLTLEWAGRKYLGLS